LKNKKLNYTTIKKKKKKKKKKKEVLSGLEFKTSKITRVLSILRKNSKKDDERHVSVI